VNLPGDKMSIAASQQPRQFPFLPQYVKPSPGIEAPSKPNELDTAGLVFVKVRSAIETHNC
jgi:hypothetical protein